MLALAEKQSSTACLSSMRLAWITSPAARSASRVQSKEQLYQGHCTYTGKPWLKTAVSLGKALHHLTRRTAGTGAAEEQAARPPKRGLCVACAPTARRTPRLQARRRAPEDDVELDDDYGWAEARCSECLVPAPVLWHLDGLAYAEPAAYGVTLLCTALRRSLDAQGDRGVQPVLKQVWAAASQAVDRLVDIAEDYAPEGVSRGAARHCCSSPWPVNGRGAAL